MVKKKYTSKRKSDVPALKRKVERHSERIKDLETRMVGLEQLIRGRR